MAEEETGVVSEEAQTDTSNGPASGQQEPQQEASVHADAPDAESEAGERAAEAPEEDFPGRVEQLEAETGQLRTALEERDSELTSLRERMASATTRYRVALLAGAPEVPEELVHGQTVEELDESLASARKVVDKIAGQLEAQVASARVPAGAPPRREPDLGALSPKEKILYALQKG